MSAKTNDGTRRSKIIEVDSLTGTMDGKEIDVQTAGNIEISDKLKDGISLSAVEYTIEYDEAKGLANRKFRDGTIKKLDLEYMKEVAKERKEQGKEINFKTTKKLDQKETGR